MPAPTCSSYKGGRSNGTGVEIKLLSLSDRPVGPALASLGALGFEAAPLVPTPTALSKKILDATAPLRDLLRKCGVHDYATQGQGQGNRVTMAAFFVGASGLQQTTASLYRPSTKHGDPRIWFSGLPSYAEPGNLLLLVPRGQVLYLINASLATPIESLALLVPPTAERTPNAERQLLSELRRIRAAGWVRADQSGPSAVGMALEKALGISPNSSLGPDYMNQIELKAQRLSSAKSRVTLFGAAPTWDLGPLKSSKALLHAFGYLREGKRRLYCTLGPKPNPQGLFLQSDNSEDAIWLMKAGTGKDARGAVWPSGAIRTALMQKHQRTAWVDARVRMEPDGREAFLFETVRFSSQPLDHLLVPLIAAGTITLDLTIKETATGGAKDHGYLFKTHKANLPALFGKLAAPVLLESA